jgi:hypothetical protein
VNRQISRPEKNGSKDAMRRSHSIISQGRLQRGPLPKGGGVSKKKKNIFGVRRNT